LRIESTKGKGTSVELWLPLGHGESVAPAAVADAVLTEPQGKSLVIVVVDDDKLVLTNAKAMLEDFGHTVIDVTSGTAALEAIRRTPHVDLVVTDQAMPQMTGMQLAAAIRVDWPELPILLVSGYAELPAKAPFDIPKLAKPFSLDDLGEAVARTMERRAVTTLSQANDWPEVYSTKR
jgi:CheY-like chemotaxis protein